MKRKTIHLEHLAVYGAFDGKPAWRVKKVTESLEYAPGAILKQTEVGPLCASPAWNVTITEAKQ